MSHKATPKRNIYAQNEIQRFNVDPSNDSHSRMITSSPLKSVTVWETGESCTKTFYINGIHTAQLDPPTDQQARTHIKNGQNTH